MNETLVKITNVEKTYTRGDERIQVLQSLSVDIARGEFLALMGPSGSGKSTLLNLIGGSTGRARDRSRSVRTASTR